MPYPQTAPRLSHGPCEKGSLSLIIPICGGLDLNRACFTSILKARSATGLPHELILVDNGSQDGSAAWMDGLQSRFDWVRVSRHATNKGFAEGCNSGLGCARGEYLAILNNDTLIEARLFSKLLMALDRTERVGLVAPVSNYVMGQQLTELEEGEGAADVEAIADRLEREAKGKITEVQKVAGLCLLGRREFFEEVGLFDPVYGLGNYEDEDLCLRARIEGCGLLIAQDAYVHHFGNQSFRHLGIDYERQLVQQKRLHRSRWRGNTLFCLEEALENKNFDRVLEQSHVLESDTHGRDWCLRARAKALLERSQEEEALPLFQEFVDRHPFHTESACLLGFCLLQQDQVLEGRQRLACVLREGYLGDVFAASVLTRLARWCWSRDLHPEARQHLTSSKQICEDFLPAKIIESGFLLEEARYDEALALLAPCRDEPHTDVLTNLGIAHFHMGHEDQARADFEAGARLGGPRSAAAKNLELLQHRT